MKVIGKLSEGKASHVPYRDSKLTRLLQSSLSGHGHVSVSLRCSDNVVDEMGYLNLLYYFVILLNLFVRAIHLMAPGTHAKIEFHYKFILPYFLIQL